MIAEPRITTILRYLPSGGAEVSYGVAHRLASPLVLVSVAAMILMPVAILWPLVRLADFLAVETLIRVASANLVFVFWWYVTRELVWAFPAHETIIAEDKPLTISRRLCGVPATRRFELRPGALGVRFEPSWSGLHKPRYCLHYESRGRKCDFARGLAEQTARELLLQLTHPDGNSRHPAAATPGSPFACERRT